MFSSTRLVAVALAATLLIAACGSDEDTAGSDTTVTEATVADTTATESTIAGTTTDTTEAMTDDTTATTDAPAQDIEADTAAAQVALLTLTDFPEGWTEAPANDTEPSEISVRIAECVGLESTGAAPATGDYSSPDANLVVSESVEVQATERDARLVMAQITNPEVPDCVAAAYAELGGAALSTGAITEGAEIGEVTASRLAVGSAGDATQAIRVVIPVISGETTAQLTVDRVFTRAGRSFTTITFEGRVEATPVETIDEITAVAASSLPA